MAKFLKNSSGTITEEAAVATTAGAGDAGKIPELNGSGILEPALINAKNTSAGAGDVGKIPQLDAAGRLDSSFLPVGIGADTAAIVASEALAAGDLVNVWDDGGTPKVRKADASTSGKEAHGFVLAAFSAAATATVYFEGPNTGVTGQTAGVKFLSDTVAGAPKATAPVGAGKVVQRIGFATSATVINFDAGDPIVLA